MGDDRKASGDVRDLRECEVEPVQSWGQRVFSTVEVQAPLKPVDPAAHPPGRLLGSLCGVGVYLADRPVDYWPRDMPCLFADSLWMVGSLAEVTRAVQSEIQARAQHALPPLRRVIIPTYEAALALMNEMGEECFYGGPWPSAEVVHSSAPCQGYARPMTSPKTISASRTMTVADFDKHLQGVLYFGIDPGHGEYTSVTSRSRDPDGEWVTRIVEWIPVEAKKVLVTIFKEDAVGGIDLASDVARVLRDRGADASPAWQYAGEPDLLRVGAPSNEVDRTDVVVLVGPTEARILKSRFHAVGVLARDTGYCVKHARAAIVDGRPEIVDTFMPPITSLSGVQECLHRGAGINFAYAPGERDAYPVGQAPGEAEEFAAHLRTTRLK